MAIQSSLSNLCSVAASSFIGMIDEVRIAADATSYSKLALDYYTQRKRNDFLKHPVGVTLVTAVSNPQCKLVPSVKSGRLLLYRFR